MSSLAWCKHHIPIPKRSRSTRPQICHASVSKPPTTVQFSRRSLVHLFLLSLPLPVLAESGLVTTKTRKHTSLSLKASIITPQSWYVSSRSSTLLVCDLSRGIIATVSQRPISMSDTSDPFNTAYEMVRDRVEEGASIFIKESSFGNAILDFRFQSETEMPDGTKVIRIGLGRSLAQPNSALLCIVTAPGDTWPNNSAVAKDVIASLHTL